ncbi:PAP2 superfamily-domain-containing protein [Lineolata rhizophorae]|uniref:PAP2 superfamily-domain-containing protein n=1 Tax=Lineolata rhizophorae TaxID=578093 RepID=A0A6A6P6A8_9PEZI|nr:PAP2 superfamily-domain-containing protein [Lineolata rhizophorae]
MAQLDAVAAGREPTAAATGAAPAPAKRVDAMGAKPGVQPGAVIDAGMRHKDHYESRLPRWRYTLRQWLIPIVRAETPYLAYMQAKLRSPALDSYFALAANLGTHTAFMVTLPVLFWCGHSGYGRAQVHMLALGVFWSGFVKDMLCLPRPLSPPLQRITMSGSAALEYGFPSTHSTNAVSVALYALWLLQSTYPSDIHHPLDSTAAAEPSSFVPLALQFLCYFYAASIIIGRLYCGMHGFFDVAVGSALGAAIAYVEWQSAARFDGWMSGPQAGLAPIIFIILAVLLLVRAHPEPADDCPCFDDSVAFAGVVIGLEIGEFRIAGWEFRNAGGRMAAAPELLSAAAAKAVGAVADVDGDAGAVGKEAAALLLVQWGKALVRIVLGVAIIFTWRGVMKPALLKALPPLFRVIEHLGVDLPRKFFLKASQYTSVPPLRRDDNVIPSASEIPSLLTQTFGHPRRPRAVSVGPQSAADAYETLAYRQQRRRRESVGSIDRPVSPVVGGGGGGNGGGGGGGGASVATGRAGGGKEGAIKHFEEMMGEGEVVMSPVSPAGRTAAAVGVDWSGGRGKADVRSGSEGVDGEAAGLERGDTVGVMKEVSAFPKFEDGGFETGGLDGAGEGQEREGEEEVEKEDREIFLRLVKPRVRYDVEVVTKLIIYSGIAWLAVEFNPYLFHVLELD